MREGGMDNEKRVSKNGRKRKRCEKKAGKEQERDNNEPTL